MEFEWDEAKNQSNLQKHGFHFGEAVFVLNSDHVRKFSPRADEDRWIAIGQVRDEIAAVVYTIRKDCYRIISIIKARHGEKREYRSLHE